MTWTTFLLVAGYIGVGAVSAAIAMMAANHFDNDPFIDGFAAFMFWPAILACAAVLVVPCAIFYLLYRRWPWQEGE